MPIVTFSEAFPRDRGGRRGRRGRVNGSSQGKGKGDGIDWPDVQKGSVAFQGRGHSLAAGRAPQAAKGTGVFAIDQRAGSGSDFQAAIQAWQAQHDDAALLAETDRLIAEHQREAATASNAPGSEKTCEEEPMYLCHSDERYAPAQQSAHAASRANAALQTAAQASEAKRRIAVMPEPPPAKQAKHMQCTEMRQLGIRDPPPLQLSGSNALLNNLADGADRATEPSKKDSDWMFRGDGAYVPIALSAVDMKLRLHEIVHVFDISLVPHPARALLDSGNGGCTLITCSFAARLQLVDGNGKPKQSSVRQTTVHGVVAGASEQIPLMSLSYELQGKRIHITAGITEAQLGCDLLLSCKEIAQFISDGFTFDIR